MCLYLYCLCVLHPQEAEAVGKKDEDRLLNTRKLALVVDLDQTMIHTTIELVPADMKVKMMILTPHNKL